MSEPSEAAPQPAGRAAPVPPVGLEPPPPPQYGQYASAAEQRARIRQPDTTAALNAGVVPARVASSSGSRSASPAGGRRWGVDRVVTIALLGYGLITVVMTSSSLIDFPTVASASMKMLGIAGEFTNVAQGRMFAAAALVALVVGWLVTAWGAGRRLRAHRISWWVPLVGAVITYVVVYALLLPAIVGDPAFQQYLRSATG